jgi:hypothetical protein
VPLGGKPFQPPCCDVVDAGFPSGADWKSGEVKKERNGVNERELKENGRL